MQIYKDLPIPSIAYHYDSQNELINSNYNYYHST